MAVLAAARALLPVREEPRNSNAGQMVEAMLAGVGNKAGDPWCAAYVSHCGYAALGKAWPLPMTASCAVLGDHAFNHGWLKETPPGDVFLCWSDAHGRFAHTGFVTENGTIEGNTVGTGESGNQREGYGVFLRKRNWKPKDRFIRWTPSEVVPGVPVAR